MPEWKRFIHQRPTRLRLPPEREMEIAGELAGRLETVYGEAPAGVAMGLLAALALTRALKGLLYGVSAGDPLIYGAVVLSQPAVGLAACFIPARRATKVDPTVALRCE
jgi:hypothetical protein